MDAEKILDQLLKQPPNEQVLALPLPDEIAESVVTRLKQEIDRNWHDDANYSVTLSEWIIRVGEKRSDLNQMALGVMARGDSLKFLGKLHDAWADLQYAGQLYLQAENEIGWGRTCIGRLYMSVDLNCVEKTLDEAERAREIFERHGEVERILRLNLNAAVVYMRIGQQHKALALYEASLSTAEALGAAGKEYEGMLYINIGYSHLELGNMQRAFDCFQRAQQIFESTSQSRGMILAELNIAYIQQARGQYRQALQHLHHVQDIAGTSFPWEYATARRMMVQCNLFLSRPEEAAELAQQVAVDYEALGVKFEQAHTLRYLATALAEVSQFEASQDALNSAETIYAQVGAAKWIANIHLQRGRLSLQMKDGDKALSLAESAYIAFEASGERAYLAEAALLQAQALYHSQQWLEAHQSAREVIDIARALKQPGLQYSAHLLLGRIDESQGSIRRAMRHYQAAHFTVERMQQGLTVTLRTGFLENKLDAIRSQFRLYLEKCNPQCAFETLERMKSQVLFSYLARQDSLHWAISDASSLKLINELEQLRQEHQWFYQTLHGERLENTPKTAQSHEQLIHEITIREKRMRAITERLYLQKDGGKPRFEMPTLAQIQNELKNRHLLIAYYNDGDALWAFVVDGDNCVAIKLPGTPVVVDNLIGQLQFNIDCALAAGADAPVTANLAAIARKLAQQLHNILVAPLIQHTLDKERLIIVPYGALHYVPFHLLYSGKEYLIEQHELVVLPTAGLITHRGPQRREGALVLAHSWDQTLRHAMTEAESVYQRFGGSIHADSQATRRVLSAPPCQILHIAAHGEYRIDHPELSFIQLADGQLYTDDVWQHDLSYELVTLSACETGRANITAGEELIGLGRGFLYAGAGALLTSLWRVPDDAAQTLTARIYDHLQNGASKAEALRSAQLATLAAQPGKHPAFWGLFQLMGDPRPLSTFQ
jgi:tetratricopeptide (TPR) repeat protein